MTNDYNYGPLEHELTGGTFAEGDDEHEQPVPEGEEWRVHRLPGERRDAVVADSRGDKLICEATPEDAATIIRDHRLAALVPGLVEALKGVSIMLNTELERYESEPWAQRVQAAITAYENAVAKES